MYMRNEGCAVVKRRGISLAAYVQHTKYDLAVRCTRQHGGKLLILTAVLQPGHLNTRTPTV